MCVVICFRLLLVVSFSVRLWCVWFSEISEVVMCMVMCWLWLMLNLM